MKHSLLKTEDYLLLIDEGAEITKEWKGYAYKEDVVGKVFKHFYTTNTWYDDVKIVMAYYPLTSESKELNLPLLPLVGLEKDNFTLEDVKKAIEMARKEYLSDGWSDSNMKHYYSEEEIIQSLSTQQLPKEFIPTELDGDDAIVQITLNGHCFKTITNSEGKEVLLGTYKY